MVEDRVTDGKRIAQLLASELSGREDGDLDTVSVVDADPDAEPVPDGSTAYRVAVREMVVAEAVIYPEVVELALVTAVDRRATDDREEGPIETTAVRERARQESIETEMVDDRPVVRVDSGAAVKRALDAVRAGL